MKSYITEATATNGITPIAAAVITANRIGAGSQAGVTASRTTLTITAAINSATAHARLTTIEVMRGENTVSLTTSEGTDAASRSADSSIARATRSGPGSVTKRPSGAGGRTRRVKGRTQGAVRAVISDPTSASAKTSTTV